jgi:hypothetical protein
VGHSVTDAKVNKFAVLLLLPGLMKMAALEGAGPAKEIINILGRRFV